MISRSVSELAGAVYSEQADFRPAAFVAVSDHRDRVFRDEHLVVPGVTRIDLGPEGIRHRDRLQRAAANRDGEQSAASEHDQIIAMQLYDVAFIKAGVLSVGDRFG